jgi:hypothetical protein
MFDFAVMPDREPPVQGELIVLDTLTWTDGPQSFEMAADAEITVRLIMDATTGQFKWEYPTVDLTCIDVINENFGDFSTGFRQWLIKAKDLDHECV